MSNIVEADYKVMQERTLPVIASEILLIEENVGRVALDGAIRIGDKLKEAKEKVEHGKWEEWCRNNLNYSKSKTEKLMKIAAEYGDENSPYSKAYTCTDLSISKALRLLQVPEDEVETFAENNDIEDMTVKDLEEEIRKLKEEKTNLEEKNGDLEAGQEELQKEIEVLKQQDADPAEIRSLEEKLEKQKDKNKNLQEKLKAEKENKDKAISEAIDQKKEELRKEAEMAEAAKLQEAWSEAECLRDQVIQLEKKIEKSSNESVLMFKLKVDQLQETYADCQNCIADTAVSDPKQADKMQTALTAVMAAMTEKGYNRGI